jgi:hypothetical protein
MVASDGTPEVPGLELICGALGTWRESADGIVADAPDTARGVLAMVYTYCPSRFDEVVRVLRADSRLSSVPFDSYVATLKG